jgi:diguanylate cyclase (GGDEF)-like protein
MFELSSVPQHMTVIALLQYRFVTDIRQEWEAFIASKEPRFSKIMQLRAAMPDFPDGVALLVHRLPGKKAEYLMLLENAAYYARLQKNVARHSEFANRIFTALPETIMLLDTAGTVVWASPPKSSALAGKNIFTLAKPATAFFQAPWDETFLAGLSQTTAMEARLQTGQTQSALLELAFTPIPDSSSHAVLVVARDLAAVRHMDDKNRPQDVLDPLTGLASHSQFYLALEREADHAQRLGAALGIIFCDLERFKQVNAMYGYQTGDSILRRVGAAIGAVTRRGMDVAARFGNDDFAVIITGASREMTATMAIKIRESVYAACKGAVEINCGLILLSGNCSGPGYAVDAARKACARARTTPGRMAWAENTEEKDTSCSTV